jgi:hypothetical protein
MYRGPLFRGLSNSLTFSLIVDFFAWLLSAHDGKAIIFLTSSAERIDGTVSWNRDV